MFLFMVWDLVEWFRIEVWGLSGIRVQGFEFGFEVWELSGVRV
jgi:hypothetical protein